MKNYTLLLITLFTATLSFAQNNWQKGFNNGFSEGYCYNDIGCVSPTAPISIPNTTSDYNSYQDGYNQGFSEGQSKKNSIKNNNSTDRKRYKTAKPKFVDNAIYKSPNNLKIETLKALDRKQDFNLAYAKTLKSKIQKIKKENPKNQQLIDVCNKYIGTIISVEEPKYVNLAQEILRKIEKSVNEIESNLESKPKEKEINDGNNFLSEVQELYQDKEFDQLIKKLKPIEDKIRQGAITDQQTLYFTYSILAYSHYNKSNLAETIKYTTKAIDNSLSNEIGDFYFLRGKSKSNIGDYYGANKDYDYLIENYKKINYNSNNLATLYNNKAYNLILLKKYEKAEPLVNKAINLDQTKDYIWGTKGELEYYLGKYYDAVNAMSKSIKIKPTANSYYFRGLAEIKLGNKKKGCSDLSKSGEMGEIKAYTEIKNRCN